MFNNIFYVQIQILQIQQIMNIETSQIINTNHVLLLKPRVRKDPQETQLKIQIKKHNAAVSEDIYYLPAYLRIKVKKLSSLQFATKTGKLNVQIHFTVFYGDFVNKVIEQTGQSNGQRQGEFNQDDFLKPFKCLADSIVLVPNDDGPIELDQLGSDVQINLRKRTINAQIRKQITTRLFFDNFWTPFEIVSEILTIKLKNTAFRYKNKEYKIRFNFMKNSQVLHMLSYCYQGSYQDYQMAERLIKVQFCNNSLPYDEQERLNIKKPHRMKTLKSIFNVQQNKEETESSQSLLYSTFENVMSSPIGSPQNFMYAHFTIPLYKYPVPTLSTIFVPIWILNLINIAIYFSAPDLSNRLSSVATLMIAYVALIPTVRSKIPANAAPTFVEILVYFEAFISMLSVIQGIDMLDQPDKKFIWYKDVYFMMTILTSSFSVVSIVILYLIHKFIWEPSYNRIPDQSSLNFDRKRWSNEQCDIEFTRFKDRIQLVYDSLDNLGKCASYQEAQISKDRYNKSAKFIKSPSLEQKLIQQQQPDF